MRISSHQGEPERLGCKAKGPEAGRKLGCPREDVPPKVRPQVRIHYPSYPGLSGFLQLRENLGNRKTDGTHSAGCTTAPMTGWKGSVSRLHRRLPHQGSAFRAASHALQSAFLKCPLQGGHCVQSGTGRHCVPPPGDSYVLWWKTTVLLLLPSLLIDKAADETCWFSKPSLLFHDGCK